MEKNTKIMTNKCPKLGFIVQNYSPFEGYIKNVFMFLVLNKIKGITVRY